MYQVIARKYRPQTFHEVVNQEHVKTTLENAIAQKRIAHGYIFSGQRGTGKTTVARILARCLNCIHGPTPHPCGECASCREITAGGTVDVIEIDAASNRGINEMRELRENVRFMPQRDQYKVFIIDEAHQITSEAFNALLKTIEEPPEWVVFVLCTTEAHKIPATIASRCQHFSFRSVDFDELVARMAWIAKEEGIEADAETLAVLAQAGEGSVRDSLSALDQAIACCGAKLNAAEVRALLGAFSLETLEGVSDALLASDSRRMLELVDELERNGHNLQHFARELARYFRNLLTARIAGPDTRLIAASAAQREKLAETASRFSEEDLTRYLQLTLDLFRDFQFALQPRFHLEIGLVRLVQAGRLTAIEEAIGKLGGEKGVGGWGLGVGENTGGSRPNPSPKTPGSATERSSPDPRPPAPDPLSGPQPPSPNSLSGPTDWRRSLHAALMELGMAFTADAVENSRVVEGNGELQFITTKSNRLALREDDLQKAVSKISSRPMRIKVVMDESGAAPGGASPSGSEPLQPPAATEDEVTARALANPEVRRFREVFGGEIRKVRNLKES
jgi:DNA polymerase III subunit gamma/tau